VEVYSQRGVRSKSVIYVLDALVEVQRSRENHPQWSAGGALTQSAQLRRHARNGIGDDVKFGRVAAK
jgi:hypothetical protein